MLDAETAKQLEEMREMNEWKAKQAAKTAVVAPTKPSPAKPVIPTTVDISESNASSQLSSTKRDPIADSYTSDDFEDTSMSGSGGQLNNIQPSKLATVKPIAKPLKKIEESSDIYEDDDFESLSRS